MKRLAIAALSASLVCGGAALAEPWHGNQGSHSNAGNAHAAPSGNFHGNPGGNFRGAPNGNFRGAPNGAFRGAPNGAFRGGPTGYQGQTRNFNGSANWQGRNFNNSANGYRGAYNTNRGYNNGYQGAYNGGYRGSVNPGGPARFAGRNWNGGRNFQGQGAWRGPHAGWGFHGWGRGAYIPRAFLVPGFFISDWAYYDLDAPQPDCEWVQDGPNALLVDIYTGQVIEEIPNAFL